VVANHAERAFNAIKRTQTVNHGEKYDWETYMKYGYWPTDLVASESVSNSLECMYDDYAAADMARLMGKKQDQQYFTRRANFYKNLFDKQTNFMRPRLADGSWRSPFNPSDVAHAETVGGDYTEGNAWQYTWQVQHDIPGLIKLFGGPKPFLKKLDEFFTLELVTSQNDVTGNGQQKHCQQFAPENAVENPGRIIEIHQNPVHHRKVQVPRGDTRITIHIDVYHQKKNTHGPAKFHDLGKRPQIVFLLHKNCI
jgi:putative alpha-1,2-mannosidase